MFRDNTDTSLWQKLMKATAAQQDLLPIFYYRPFKMSLYYLRHHFGKEDSKLGEELMV